VVSGPNDALAAELGDWIDWTPEADQISETIRAAVGRGPRTASELRALLRDLFHGHDTTSSVDALASLIGVRGAARRRHASVVVQPEEGVRLDAFLDSVILQSFRPKDALIAVDDPVAARMAIAELERAGIAARVLPPPAPDRGIARWAAPLVSTDWLWLWSPKARPDRDFLLDAVIHGCVTGAEAIGRGDAVESGFTDGSGLERLDGLVVSRHAAMTLPDVHAGLAAAWHARGARVYAVGMDRDGR
jgi:hypothetical protein